MGRPSVRAERRAEILRAFARVLADHGYAGATVAAVAQEAGVAPGLVHHHFDGKAELLSCLLKELVARHRARVAEREGEPLAAYVDAALALDARADTLAARCWVSLFAEALRDKDLYEQMRRLIDTELAGIARRGGGELDAHGAGAVLAYVIGALVLGAYAPRVTAGFAAPGAHALIAALRGG
jgi:TetR/AcrR family transcriptional regulator, transcriptional repressor of bet genes